MSVFDPLLGLADDAVVLASRMKEWRDQSVNGNPRQRSGMRQVGAGNLGKQSTPWSELDWGDGALLGLPPITYANRRPPRGEFLAGVTGWTVGLVTTAGLCFSLAPALRFFAPILRGPGSKVAGALLVGYGALGLGKFAARSVRFMSNLDQNVRRIRMGGDYQDTATAQALRMAAARDMSSSFGSARRFLGREANYLS